MAYLSLYTSHLAISMWHMHIYIYAYNYSYNYYDVTDITVCDSLIIHKCPSSHSTLAVATVAIAICHDN